MSIDYILSTIKRAFFDGTGALRVPTGTTAQRPTVPSEGFLRGNTDDGIVEIYINDAWVTAGSGGGGGVGVGSDPSAIIDASPTLELILSEGNKTPPSPLSFERDTVANEFSRDGVYTEAAINEPRLSYDVDSWDYKGVLLEGATTNLLQQSNQFDTTWTTNQASVTQDQTGLDDTTSAWSITPSANGGYITQSVSISTSTQYTFSVYAKADVANWLQLELTDFNAVEVNAWFNLTSGTTGSSTVAGWTDVTIGMEDVGDGFYRCWVTGTSEGSATDTSVTIRGTSADSANSILNEPVTITNAQLEAGHMVTSYVSTTNGSGTRNADYMTFSSTDGVFFNPDQGTWYVEAYTPRVADPNNDECFVQINDGSKSFSLFRDISTNTVFSLFGSGGPSTTQLDADVVADGTRFKVAFSYSQTTQNISVNGSFATGNISGFPDLSNGEGFVGTGSGDANRATTTYLRVSYWPKFADEDTITTMTS